MVFYSKNTNSILLFISSIQNKYMISMFFLRSCWSNGDWLTEIYTSFYYICRLLNTHSIDDKTYLLKWSDSIVFTLFWYCINMCFKSNFDFCPECSLLDIVNFFSYYVYMYVLFCVCHTILNKCLLFFPCQHTRPHPIRKHNLLPISNTTVWW